MQIYGKTMKKAFTLIELLVVISVIGILTTLVLVSFGPAQKQARDTQRKSDIKQYQNALEMYANKYNGLFVVSVASIDPSSICVTLTGSATGCPTDPKSGTSPYGYYYQTDASGSKYVLWAKLEGSTNYWVNCSNGKVGTKAQSGFSVSGGTCPI
jgi:prepilin-type N-terminal cleavage/methylation domain-containing protein